MRFLCIGLLAAATVSEPAWAANVDSTKPTIDLQLFHPSPDAKGFFSTESAELNGHLGISAGLNISYARNPLQVRVIQPDGSEEDIGTVIKYRIDATVLAALGLFDIGQLGIAMPLVTQGGLDANAFTAANVDIGTDTLKGFTQGDLRVIPKVQALNLADGLFSLAVLATVIVPTAQKAPYASEAGMVYAPSLALSSRVGPFRAGLNAGYRLRKRTRVQTLVVDDEIFYKLGLAVDLGSDNSFEIVGEVFGHTPAENAFAVRSKGIKKQFQNARTPLEGDIGLRMVLLDNFIITVGGGGGIMPGYGAPVPRAFASFGYYSGDVGILDQDNDTISDEFDKCPEKKEDLDQFEDEDGCPDLDNDKDNVLDEDDQCPNEPEGDKDGFNDDDGCPDPDNDEDTILDEVDACPVEAEDLDGYEDEDGCPDLDNDGDQIADTVDKCPMEAEDVDGFMDSDGCPEPDNDGDGLSDLNDMCPNHAEDFDQVADDDGCPEDNDGDGIMDADDKCPNKAESYNGIEDEDGCPEALKAKSLVEVTDEKIEIKEKVFFRSGSAKILSKSFKLLDQVAAVLKNYKHLTKIRIEGHTDSRGSKKRNRRLSKQRAEAVRDYLVDKGILPDRLEAQGLGPDRSIASNRSKRGREMNRRVEFVIAEQKQIGEDVSETQVDEAAIEFDMPLEEVPEEPAAEEPQPEMDLESEGEIEFEMTLDEPPAETQPAEEAPQQEAPPAEEEDDLQFEF